MPPESPSNPTRRDMGRFVLGIDGGQTSTTAIVLDETGILRGIGHGGPANHIHEPGGVERVRASLRDAILAACSQAGSARLPISSAYLGMTGGSAEMEQVCRPAVPGNRMILGHDSLIALYSVTMGQPGVAVIGGTGSIGYGRTATGQTATAGGWGYIMGDEGSAYWISIRALQECTKSADGRRPRTRLAEYLLKHADEPDFWQIHRRIYSGGMSRPEIAGFAAAVGKAAGDGDRTARAILREAGDELGLLAATVIRKLGVGDRAVSVGYVGGVFRAGEFVMRPFKAAVLAAAPLAVLLPPKVPAAVAAAMLAMEDLGVRITDDIRERVCASLPAFGEIKQ